MVRLPLVETLMSMLKAMSQDFKQVGLVQGVQCWIGYGATDAGILLVLQVRTGHGFQLPLAVIWATTMSLLQRLVQV